jgi:PAS domain S-box-containing protein
MALFSDGMDTSLLSRDLPRDVIPGVHCLGMVRALMRNAPYGIALLDDNLRFEWVNPCFVMVLGRDDRAYQGRQLRSLIHPEDSPAFEGLLAQVLTGVFPFGWMDIRMISTEGRSVWLGMNLTRSEAPGSRSFVATFLDIGERKAGEWQLRQLRENLSELQNSARIGQLDYLPDSGLVRVSPAWMRLLSLGTGYTECTLDRFLDLFHPEERGRIAMVFRTQPTGREFDLELRGAHSLTRHLRCIGQVQYDERQGRFWRLTGQDITDWWENELRFRSIFEDNHLPMLLIHLGDEQIRSANPAAVRFYGYQESELQKMSLNDLGGNDPNGGEFISDTPTVRARHRLASGQMRDVTLIPSRFHHDKEPLAFIIVLDITEQIRSSAALSELNRTLEQRIEKEVRKIREQEKKLSHQARLAALGEMASGIAHEINQPLNTISVTLDNLLAEIAVQNPTSFVKEKTEKIFQSISRLRTFIDHIRVFSRAQDEPLHEKFAINESIDNTLAIVAHRLKRESINLLLDLEPVPEAQGNPYKFEQVLMNLLSNSIDALLAKTGDYERRIEIRMRTEAGRILLEIEDNGSGIESRLLPHVMEPFFTTKETDKGTGLGLSISYGTISEMGGTIEIYSRHRHWTLVRIELPLNDEANHEN